MRTQGKYASVNGLNMYYEIHGTTHITLVERADWLLSMITAFLDAPNRRQDNENAPNPP